MTDATATERLPLAGAPAIPGMVIRRFRHDDYPAVAELIRVTSLADAIPWMPTADNLRIEFENTDGLDTAKDIVVVEIDDRVIATAGVQHVIRAGAPTYETFGQVHPEHRRRGIGTMLVAENLRRIRERGANELGHDQVLTAASFVEETEIGSRTILTAAGFEADRTFFLMRHPDLANIPDAPIPDGLEIRPVTPDQHRAILDAEAEAMRDHWNAREHGEDDFRATFAKAELDTDLWAVAWDGDAVAGVVQAWIWTDENAALGIRRGWLERISVRRPWRRRGLARAITAHAMRRLRDAGMDDAMLGVDSASPTGALALYQGLGFVVHSRATSFHIDLSRQG